LRLAAHGIGFLLLAIPIQAATVLSVGDGDTITISNDAQKIRVRLAYIDAPETYQTHYGMESRQALQRLLPIREEVTVRSKAIGCYAHEYPNQNYNDQALSMMPRRSSKFSLK
jgi:endonuclease YncB( thermonuclease family)